MDKNLKIQLKMDDVLKKIQEENKGSKTPPTLLLHSCCAPCSSYVLEYLSQIFSITIFYFNPNIGEETEYRKRVEEQKRLLTQLPVKYPVSFVEGVYDVSLFRQAIEGKEHLGERSARCYACYKLRLEETCKYARNKQYDYFTTTLSISPHKNAAWLNEIGYLLSDEYGVSYLYSDFKKKNGYKRSIELSEKYNLYRQDYCGCIYSKEEEQKRKLKV